MAFSFTCYNLCVRSSSSLIFTGFLVAFRSQDTTDFALYAGRKQKSPEGPTRRSSRKRCCFSKQISRGNCHTQSSQGYEKVTSLTDLHWSIRGVSIQGLQSERPWCQVCHVASWSHYEVQTLRRIGAAPMLPDFRPYAQVQCERWALVCNHTRTCLGSGEMNQDLAEGSCSSQLSSLISHRNCEPLPMHGHGGCTHEKLHPDTLGILEAAHVPGVSMTWPTSLRL